MLNVLSMFVHHDIIVKELKNVKKKYILIYEDKTSRQHNNYLLPLLFSPCI